MSNESSSRPFTAVSPGWGIAPSGSRLDLCNGRRAGDASVFHRVKAALHAVKAAFHRLKAAFHPGKALAYFDLAALKIVYFEVQPVFQPFDLAAEIRAQPFDLGRPARPPDRRWTALRLPRRLRLPSARRSACGTALLVHFPWLVSYSPPECAANGEPSLHRASNSPSRSAARRRRRPRPEQPCIGNLKDMRGRRGITRAGPPRQRKLPSRGLKQG